MPLFLADFHGRTTSRAVPEIEDWMRTPNRGGRKEHGWFTEISEYNGFLRIMPPRENRLTVRRREAKARPFDELHEMARR